MNIRALNHMAAPNFGWADFLQLAKALGCVGVEFRNDLPGRLFDGAAPEDVRASTRAAGLRIFALAEVKAFNDWSDAKREETAALIEIATACGAEMVSLIARNDGRGMGRAQRREDLRTAISELKPLFESSGLKGLIEPLGFESCALRDKGEAVEAIEALSAGEQFRIVHDTFHHALAGGGPLYPEHTGVVHISGVVVPDLSPAEIRDEHRVLVDERDRLGNIEQLAGLLAADYTGPVSFEPFAAEIHALTEPLQAYAQSFEFVEAELGRIEPARSKCRPPLSGPERHNQVGADADHSFSRPQ